MESHKKQPTLPDLYLPAANEFDDDHLFVSKRAISDANSVAPDLPADGDVNARTVKYAGHPNDKAKSASNGEAQSASIASSPGNAESNLSIQMKPPANSLASIDEDYRLFLEHTRIENGGLVLEFNGQTVNYG